MPLLLVVPLLLLGLVALVLWLVLGGGGRQLVQLGGAGLQVRSAAKAWVTPGVRDAMLRAGAAAAALGLQVQVLDASREGGGPFPPHKSHQAGRDVDVRYLPTAAMVEVLRAAAPAHVWVSRERVGPLGAAGLPVSYWPGHVDHAHLRW